MTIDHTIGIFILLNKFQVFLVKYLSPQMKVSKKCIQIISYPYLYTSTYHDKLDSCIKLGTSVNGRVVTATLQIHNQIAHFNMPVLHILDDRSLMIGWIKNSWKDVLCIRFRVRLSLCLWTGYRVHLLT